MTDFPETGSANPGSGRRSEVPHPATIAFISSVVLVLELALIRQIPAEVRVISYFTNLLLMASFFGLGVGCILQQKRSLAWLFPAGLLLLFAGVALGRGIVFYSEASQVHYWLQTEGEGAALRLPMLPSAIFAFLATALPFLALGQALARAMDRHPRLVAYGWDIAGSLAGVLIFALASLLHMPPWVWPPIVSALWALVFLQSTSKRLLWMVPGFLFLFFAYSPQEWKWSPYYFIQYSKEELGLRVWVNSGFHQNAIDFTSTRPQDRELQLRLMDRWSRPYQLFRELNGRRPRKVLILGAGTGNDVVVARAHQVEDIVAVEIDPVILSLGETHNPSRPYASPEVRAYVDDARHFLHASDERFDLIVFGTLDSQTLLSGQANLRLENYVYTRESLLDAKRLLVDGGVVAVYYSVHRPWLFGRLYATVREAFGEHSTVLIDSENLLFNATVIGVKGVDSYRGDSADLPDIESAIPSTDDWPFIYLEKPTIAPLYLSLIAVLLALIAGVFVLLQRIHPVTGLHADFLFLGLGFTLLESSAIVRLALLFGSTWTINPIVFAAALATIFLANRGVLLGRAPSLAIAWPAVCALVLVNYFLPVSWLLGLPTVPRILACGLLIGAPIYFAAICFSRLFQRQKITGYPLGLNLIGAMAGGLIEYLSMLIGMRQVWLVVLAIYALAWASSVFVERRQT